jgi:hypothetical protein
MTIQNLPDGAMNLFASVAELAASDYVFRIQDNGGATADRYTVVFCDGDYLGMSSYPTHPQGVSMWGEGIDPQAMSEWLENEEAVDLALGDLPPKIAEHIVARVNQGWKDFLALIEARDATAVAPDREKAEVNEGSYNSGGRGIYSEGEGYRVRLDGDAADDRGPYATAAEALRGTLPDQYSFSGPEYHSTEDVSRLQASPEVTAKLAVLEAKIEADYQAARPSFG